jgi:capsular polysaccharide biosynthesis protein
MILVVNLRRVFGSDIEITGANGVKISFKAKRKFTFNTKSLLDDFKFMLGDTRQEDIKFVNNKYSIILKDMIRHPVFFLLRPLRTWTIKTEQISKEVLPIKISIRDNLDGKVWVSRQAVLSGVLPTDLDISLELDYLRGLNGLEAMVRNVDLEGINYNFFHPRKFKLQDFVQHEKPSLTHEVLSGATIISGRLVIHQDTIIPISNYRNEIVIHKPSYLQIDESNCDYKIINSFRERTRIEKAIYFGSSASWFHFLIECLPRLISIPKEERWKIPVILPEGLPPQIIEVCERITGTKSIQIRMMESVNVDQLVLGVERSVTDPLEFEFREKHIQKALSELKETSKICEARSNHFEKIFLLRPIGLFRPMQNQKQILRLLKRNGFEIVSPEKLDLEQVMEIMAAAKLIVAESGAAITNVIFSNKGANLIEIYPGKGPLTFWPALASISGIKVTKVMSKKLILGPRGIARDGIYVSKRELACAIESLL